MAVKDIIKEWLITNGYDGLYNAHICYGCFVDDLFPCDADIDCYYVGECLPGYVNIIKEDDHEECSKGTKIIGPIKNEHNNS